MIYLDHNATTPLDRRVLAAMLPYFGERFGNAASRQHAVGRRAARAVEQARGRVAALIGADRRELSFTSGATEANNLAIKGFAAWHAAAVGRSGRHLITSSIEHPSVIEPCDRLAEQGWQVTRIEPTAEGQITADALAAALRPDTVLVSVMLANHEIGTINAVAELAAVVKRQGRDILFHTDATQAVGKVAVDVDTLGVDMLSLSAHKFYGPQGVGALYTRRRRPRVRLAPLLDGGGHENGLRAGTLNLPGIVGLGEAARIASDRLATDAVRLADLRDRLERQLLEHIPGARRNGAADPRLPHTTNLSLGPVDAERLIAAMPELAVSSAAACTTAAMRSSRVLRRMGLDEATARASVRFGLGRGNTADEIDRAGAMVVEAVKNHDPASPACDARL